MYIHWGLERVKREGERSNIASSLRKRTATGLRASHAQQLRTVEKEEEIRLRWSQIL